MTPTALNKELLVKIEKGLQSLDLPEFPTTLYEPYTYAISVGGKRIRPLLTMLSAGMCGGDPDDALPAALAVEILHNFTLVHDDIMDSADTRRGKPSVFKKWNENVAILSGDLMFADGIQKLNWYGTNDSYSKEEFAAIYEVYLQSVVTVCEGQAMDMEFVDRPEITLEDYIEMISGKTAALLSSSLELGGITAHASTDERARLDQLGKEMGIAFQIQDDLLDAIANPEKFGKRPGGDIFEGKKTYLTILALERANSDQKEVILNTLNSKKTDEASVNKVLELMNELKVIEDVSEIVRKTYQNANDLIAQFNESKYRKELENLLIFLQNRDH
ncbi:MAG TPA: polyprenyl synthetase family protein [Balneolaceae bacterium]|nr:polyprenyl synthetase family protein [Balneolaceae bacterium]